MIKMNIMEFNDEIIRTDLIKTTTISSFILSLVFKDITLSMEVAMSVFLLNVITGVLKGYKAKEFSTMRLEESLIKLFGFLILIGLGLQIDRLFPQGLFNKVHFVEIISYSFTAYFSISIIENLDKLGIYVPKPVKKALKSFKNEIEMNNK